VRRMASSSSHRNTTGRFPAAKERNRLVSKAKTNRFSTSRWHCSHAAGGLLRWLTHAVSYAPGADVDRGSDTHPARGVVTLRPKIRRDDAGTHRSADQGHGQASARGLRKIPAPLEPGSTETRAAGRFFFGEKFHYIYFHFRVILIWQDPAQPDPGRASMPSAATKRTNGKPGPQPQSMRSASLLRANFQVRHGAALEGDESVAPTSR